MRRAPARPIPRFAIGAACWLALGLGLPLALPALRGPYVRAVHAQANFAFGAFGPERAVRLSAPEARGDGSDTRMVGYERSRIEPRFEAHFSIFWRSYAPIACLAALVLATPLPWRRRLVALAIGAGAQQALALALTALLAAAAFRSADAAPELADATRRLSRVAHQLFNQELPRGIFVLLVWALLTQPGRALASRAGRAPR